MRMFPDPEQRSNGLDRIHTRCTIGAIAAVAGYIGTLIVDFVRHTPTDDSTVIGLEIGFVAVSLLCSLVAAMTWIITEHQEYAAAVWSLKDRAGAQIEREAALEMAAAYGGDNLIPIARRRGAS